MNIMLVDQTAAIEIADKENDLSTIKTPFVAPFIGNFITVYKVDTEMVSLFAGCQFLRMLFLSFRLILRECLLLRAVARGR